MIIVVHIMRELKKSGMINPDKFGGSKIHSANESVKNKYILLSLIRIIRWYSGIGVVGSVKVI